MSSNGKQLESLVAFVEEKLLPSGFDVKSNERVFNDEGIQIAEFDIEIKGKVGTTFISWLIECRDRPGYGAAPGSWIEQLVGRRSRFGFNKVTAVSTTGFAVGATSFAKEVGIELREVRSLDPAEFEAWLQITVINEVRRVADLKHANIFIHPDETDNSRQAVTQVIARATGNAKILISSSTSEMASFSEAFFAAVQTVGDAFDGIVAGRPHKICLRSQYLDADHYLLDTGSGLVRINQIEFIGELRLEELEVPIIKTSEYRHTDTGEVISQLATFAPQSIFGMKLTLEMHHMADTGKTYVTMRRLPDDK